MTFKFGKLDFTVRITRRELTIAFGRKASATVQQFGAWLCVEPAADLSLFAGVTVGEFKPGIDTLRSIELSIWKGKFKSIVNRLKKGE